MSASTTSTAAVWIARIKAVLPPGWFGEAGSTPVLDGITAAFGATHEYVSAWTAYARLQVRLATATDDFLDTLCVDFLGTRIARNSGETDASFRTRIRTEILRPRATRAAMVSALEDLTGQTPLVFEPGNSSDTGGYDLGGCGYDAAGAYGDITIPFQFFLTVYRPPITGVPTVDGYDKPAGGYDSQGAIEYVDPAAVIGIPDALIYSTIESTRPAATLAWVRLTNKPPVSAVGTLGSNFILGVSKLGSELS